MNNLGFFKDLQRLLRFRRKLFNCSEIKFFVLPGDPGFFNCLANHDTILFELLGQNGVEERVEARVQRQDKDREDLGLLNIE